MYICLIRHGETDWNKQGILQGREDIPLNENGIAQSHKCSVLLKNKKWDVVISSPLQRAKLTANIIASAMNIDEVIVDYDFIERDYGKASGLSYNERMKIYPDGNYDESEDINELKNRVYGAIMKYIKNNNNKNIIIVSHGGTISAFFAKISNDTLGVGANKLKNSCLSLLKCENNNIEIEFYNKTVDEILW